MNYPRILITACGSGSGKTTVMCALAAALKKRMRVSAFKCGPDYIDPMFHTSLGTMCKNLDPFFCDEQLIKALFAKQAKNADISLIEGVMGYYDGIGMTETRASSYEVSGLLSCPSVLVVNAHGMAATAIALIKGMTDFKPDSNIKGVILNNVSGHVYAALKPEIEKTGVKALGFLPKNEAFVIESRHLGLVTPNELDDLENKMRLLGEAAEEYIDIDGVINLAKAVPPLEYCEKRRTPEFDLKIGIACDNAFCFYYRDNLELLEELGCELVYFSPLEDSRLPDGLDGLIIGGGYPELYLQRLSRNADMRNSIKTVLENGLPCLAECGGFMYLQKSIEDGGKSYPMVGFIDSVSEKKGRLVRFGYITLEDSAGNEIKAHEFHYFDSTDNGAEFIAKKANGRSYACMHKKNNCICGYPHIFYPANEGFVREFLQKCKERKNVNDSHM